MRKWMVISLILVILTASLILVSFYMVDRQKAHPVIPRSLQVSRLWLDNQYEVVLSFISEINNIKRSESRAKRYLQATQLYRKRGIWVRHLKPTDVHFAKVVNFSPKAKAFLISTFFPSIAVPSEIEIYLRQSNPNQSPPSVLNRFIFVEVQAREVTFLQAWHLDSDGEWRILSWPFDGDPETTKGMLRLMRDFGIRE